MGIALTILRTTAASVVGAWLAVSVIGFELEIMTTTPHLEKTMARDPEYGYASVKWFVTNRNVIALAGGAVGASIGALLRFPSEVR